MRRLYILIALIFGALVIFIQTEKGYRVGKIKIEDSTVYGTMEFVLSSKYIVIADVNITFLSNNPYSPEQTMKAFQSVKVSLIQAVREFGMDWPERGYSPAPVTSLPESVDSPKRATSVPDIPALSTQDIRRMNDVCNALITRVNMSNTRERIMKCEIFNFARIQIE